MSDELSRSFLATDRHGETPDERMARRCRDAISHARWMVDYWRKQADAQLGNIADGNLVAFGMANTYRECSNIVAHLILHASPREDVEPVPTSALWERRDDIASGNVWPEGEGS